MRVSTALSTAGVAAATGLCAFSLTVGGAFAQGWSPSGGASSCDSVFVPAYNSGWQTGYNEGLAVGQAAYNEGVAAAQAACNEGVAAAQAAYNEGVAAAQAAGFQSGYGSGQGDTLATCQADPNACGIYLGSCLSAPQYGETEPNDNIVTADPLLLDTKFWGQAYSLDDRDWYYLVTSEPNQNLTINFSVPTGTVAGWEVSVRDAAGNVFARFDAGAVPGSTSPEGDISYRTTLGLVGTYYISLRPTALNYEPYNLAIIIQRSPLETQNFIAGFYDAEMEPNDLPATASNLATGVAMFGVINLNFAPGTEVPDPDGDGYQYSQGADDDWYAYTSPGNELLSLEICNQAECTAGNWFFELYDAAGAAQVAAGNYVSPLLAVNSDIGSADQYVVGIGAPGVYYLRVTHKRLLTAACDTYVQDRNYNQLADDDEDVKCSCESGFECEIKVPNPEVKKDDRWSCLDNDPPDCPRCDDGTGGDGETQCTYACICKKFRGVIQMPQEAVTSQYNFSLFGTNLPPNTADSDAYPAFQDRPNPYLQ
jgi:hypothetical protein